MGVFFLSPLTIVPAILVGVTAALIGSFGLGILDVDGIHNQIKQKVCEDGLKNFNESNDKIAEVIYETISSAFSSRVEAADIAIKQMILFYENLLDQQEKVHKKTLEERQAAKAFIAEKRQEIEEVQRILKQSFLLIA
jgi:hypothetical protein